MFCGSSNNIAQEFFDEGARIGKILAERGYHVVYGAGDCGVMGAVANAALENGGTVTGVFPKVLMGLEAEHKGLTEIIHVDDMHTRKMTMFEKSDAFIILPGGFGTMDELFEVITWKQLNTHEKPIIIYNYKNYWDHWISLTEQFIKLGFAHKSARRLYHMVDSIDAMFERL